MMSRQHYEMIAGVIRARRAAYPTPADDEGALELYGTALEFSLVLAKDNPAFNRTRFLKACGVES